MLQQELYPGFIYNVENSFFHTFEMSKYIAGLSFANETHAKQFHEKVVECCNISPTEVVEVSLKFPNYQNDCLTFLIFVKDEHDSKEKTYRMVGDSDWRKGHDVSAKVAMKYAGGGITDGIEVNWKKSDNLPPELAAIVNSG